VFQVQNVPKIDGGWGFAPGPTGGAYSVPPELLAGFRGKGPEEREEKGEW